ncbi:MAG: hypothetical protein II540_07135 [Paludibacteraceae bacterium]|nr:hypothetical protein [Paludibacteraceae bacterium]
MKHFLYIIMGLMVVIMTGCDNNTNTTTLSSVAQLKAFSFAKNDSFPGLAAAVFTIDERLDTGLVWNKDSMLYGTRLDSVVPRFTFATTPGAAFLTFPDTTVVLTGYDTLDFNPRPIYLTLRSADKSTTKVYEIRPSVHQIDPDLYTWTQLTAAVYPEDDSEQRVVELGADFVMVVSNGFELRVFRSADGAEWSSPAVPTGLPAGTRVRQIISDGTTLYYGQDNAVYTSTDAVTWTAHNVSYDVRTMLLYWNEQVWALTGDEGNYELATYANGALTLTGLRPDGLFPVSDFASVTFHSPSLRERAMIIGGFAENGQSLNTRWNLEYSRHTPENNGYRLQEFSIDRPSFKSLTGISVIDYNGQLLLFGGVDDKMTYYGRDILISDDEGLNWYAADTAKNQLPEVYQARQKQTAIVRNNDIYLFGGQDKQTTFSDVYKGRLNSIDW